MQVPRTKNADPASFSIIALAVRKNGNGVSHLRGGKMQIASYFLRFTGNKNVILFSIVVIERKG